MRLLSATRFNWLERQRRTPSPESVSYEVAVCQPKRWGKNVVPYTAALTGTFAKLANARVHRGDLASFIEQQFQGVTPSLRVDWQQERERPLVSARLDPSTGEHVFSIDSVPPGLADFQVAVAVKLGDCIQNLRASLDHLVYQLACVNTGGTPTKPTRTQFLIVSAASDFADQAKRFLGEVV